MLNSLILEQLIIDKRATIMYSIKSDANLAWIATKGVSYVILNPSMLRLKFL